MKRLIYFVLLFALSKMTFGKGSSGVYYIKGTAFVTGKVVLKNSALTVVVGKETKTVSTNEKGHFEIEIKWSNACRSMISKEKHAAINERINPKIIYIKYGEEQIELENNWQKYARVMPKNKKQVTKKQNLTFEPK